MCFKKGALPLAYPTIFISVREFTDCEIVFKIKPNIVLLSTPSVQYSCIYNIQMWMQKKTTQSVLRRGQKQIIEYFFEYCVSSKHFKSLSAPSICSHSSVSTAEKNKLL